VWILIDKLGAILRRKPAPLEKILATFESAPGGSLVWLVPEEFYSERYSDGMGLFWKELELCGKGTILDLCKKMTPVRGETTRTELVPQESYWIMFKRDGKCKAQPHTFLPGLERVYTSWKVAAHPCP
jgi:hypothetical protein